MVIRVVRKLVTYPLDFTDQPPIIVPPQELELEINKREKVFV